VGSGRYPFSCLPACYATPKMASRWLRGNCMRQWHSIKAIFGFLRAALGILVALPALAYPDRPVTA
jgi:hypothetical protein